MKKKTERYSRQREQILKTLKGTTVHPTAEWLYFKVKRKLPRLSLGTVYRNLNYLYQNGAIKKFNFGTPFEHFDGNISPHQHFVCRGCGKIYDLCLDLEKEIKAKVPRITKFKIERAEIEFHGVCSSCLKLT
jgi:Fur family peroxide stress response transcriptional regulator